MGGRPGGRVRGRRFASGGQARFGTRVALAVATGLVLVGLLASAEVLVRRTAAEGPRAGPVELVMDWDALAEAAGGWGIAPGDALDRLAKQGVTTLALTELTAAELAARGRALLLSADQLQVLRRWLSGPAVGPEGGGSLGQSTDEAAWVRSGARADSGGRADDGTWLLMASGSPRRIPVPLTQAGEYRVGFPQEGWDAARRAGVAVMLRYGPGPRVWDRAEPPTGPYGVPEGVRLSRVSIFVGDKLPPLEEANWLLRQHGAAAGMVEFSAQDPIRALARQFGVGVATVHSARAEELQALGPQAAADRYLRAVRERGVRVLYLRPVGSLQETVEMVARIGDGLRREGYSVGLFAPRPAFVGPSPLQAGRMVAALPGLALAGWLAWLRARGMRPDGPVARRAAAVALAVWALAGATVVWAGAGGWDRPLFVRARQALALAAALVGPPAALGAALAAATASLDGRSDGAKGRDRAAGLRGEAQLGASAPPWRVPVAVAAYAGVSLAAGLVVGGVLSDEQFMLRLELFRGVKAAHAVPVLASAALAFWAAGGGLERWRSGIAAPIRWRDAALALALLAAAAYYLARTGNELAPVSAVERWLRGWLEEALEVRPRSKEFLVGYPGLAIALFLWGRGLASGRPWLFAAVSAAASVAAISVINSWAHVHTPVAVTLLRVGNGLVAGGVTGILAWAAAAAWVQPGRRAAAEGSASPEGRPLGVLRLR